MRHAGARTVWLVMTGVALLGPAPVEGGAWLQGPGHAYTKIALTHAVADDTLGAGGSRGRMTSDGRFGDTSLSLYMERGLVEHVDLVVSTAFKRLTFRNDAGSDEATAGLGDASLAARVGTLRAGPLLTAVRAGVKLPLGYDDAGAPPLGSGRVDYDLHLLLSSSLHPWPAYVTAAVGHRWRGGLADEVPFLIEGGVQVRGAWVRLTVLGVDSRGGGARRGGPFELVTREEDYVKISPGVAIPLDDWLGLELAYARVLTGKNTIESRELSVGISLRD